MVRFSKLVPDGKGGATETEVRNIKRSDMLKCPHVILVAEHYRDDGSCKCNDPNETVMREWGYKWDKAKNQWM